MPFLSLDGVSKRFGGVTAVDHVSFAVDRGQVVGFLGPNGAGKSTTMRMITQFYEPDTGTIRLDGAPLGDAGRAAKRRIGYLPENNPLYEDMLVHDYLAFIADLRELAGAGRRQALDAAVTGTGIETVYYRPIAELSKGFRQGAGVAEALAQLPGVRRVTPAPVAIDGHVAVTLTADGSRDLRPEIFALAQSRGWTLYELHRQAGTLEDLFHQLTQPGD